MAINPDPKRKPEPEEAPRVEQAAGAAGAAGAPDPWGVRRAENLLTSLEGVLSARLEVSPVGEVTAVHVLAHSETSPKQMVRNVESALLAQLGLKVDHRKISIAQTAEVRPIEVLEQSAVREEALRRGVVFKAVEVVPVGEHRVRVTVKLTVQGNEVVREEEVADTKKARLQGSARATVSLLDQVLPSGTCELDGVKTIMEFDTEVIVAAVNVMEGRATHLLTGTAEEKGNPERAAVLAVLDATNRWVQSRTS